MAKLSVKAIKIEDLLDEVESNTWLVPTFQRDFVWSDADVVSLVLSVLEARPIGMATLWEQPDGSHGLDLEPISIPDVSGARYLCEQPDLRPSQMFAILDGRQRSTALAMAFGGLRAFDPRRRFSGRFFLDVTRDEMSDRVQYIKDAEVKKRELDKTNVAIGQGLFPLAKGKDGLVGQWMAYLQALQDPANYPNGVLPDAVELAKRNEILKAAFKGINDTLLAVYVVPSDYDLGDICEIFETLNTTGTKVSTVDLLHSWLYADTAAEPEPIELREWIDDLGQIEGAIGWSAKAERPELIAQAITASYVLMETDKPAPRAVGGRKSAQVSSVKAGDLLATPPLFWKAAIENRDSFASYIGGFQDAVAGARFPLGECPYPVMMPMYVAIRWYMDHDPRYSAQWSVDELDALFRAFFWRNCLATRYDQGFLTQSAKDLKDLKEILFERAKHPNSNSWASAAAVGLASKMLLEVPRPDSLVPVVLGRRPPGALGKTLGLAVRTRPPLDLLDPNVSVRFPSKEPVELHHIYPRAWCANNQHGDLAAVLDPNKAAYDYVASTANLMPLTRVSNNEWRAKTPGQALTDHGITHANAGPRLETNFIDASAYAALTSAQPQPKEFWEARAAKIAKALADGCEVTF